MASEDAPLRMALGPKAVVLALGNGGLQRFDLELRPKAPPVADAGIRCCMHAALATTGNSLTAGGRQRPWQLHSLRKPQPNGLAVLAGLFVPTACVRSRCIDQDALKFSHLPVMLLLHAVLLTADKRAQQLACMGVVKCLAFSGDGRLLALGGEDGSLTVLDWLTLRPRIELRSAPPWKSTLFANAQQRVNQGAVKQGLAGPKMGSSEHAASKVRSVKCGMQQDVGMTPDVSLLGSANSCSGQTCAWAMVHPHARALLCCILSRVLRAWLHAWRAALDLDLCGCAGGTWD